MNGEVFYPQLTGQVGGNTAGATANISSGSFLLAGGNNVTLSQNGNSITISGQNAGGVQTGISAIYDGTNSISSGTVRVSNSNNVSFGINGNTLTASASYSQSTGPNAVYDGANSITSGTIRFSNSNGLAFGINGQTITGSYTVPTQSTQPVAASASNGSFNFSTLKFVEGSGVTWATQVGGIQASVKTDYQSSNANYLTSQSNQAVSGSNGSFTFQTLSLSNANGISFGTSAGSAITASHNALTTARASTDAVGLNTAKTNVTWTVNSSGISLDAGGYAGTQTGATNANITVNSNGVSVSVSPGGAGDGVNILAAGTQTANTTGTVKFVDSNGMAFGMSNSSQITASYTVPTQTNQTIGIYGSGNTSGTSSGTLDARSMTFNVSGSLTVDMTNGKVNISAPNALTTAMASNRGTDFVQANAAFAGTNASGTIASNGISVSVNATVAQTNQTIGVYGSSQTTGSASSGTHDARSMSFIGAGAISIGNHSTSAGGTTTGIIISSPVQSAQTQSNIQAVYDGANSISTGTIRFSNSNGLAFGINGQTITGSYTVPTVTNSSFSVQDSATTINPVARVAFSTGNNITLSLSTGASSVTVGVAHNLAGTSSGFGGNLISGSMTHNSSGLNLSLSHPAWLTTAAQSNQVVNALIAGTATNAATNQSSSLTGSMTLSNLNGFSFYTTASGATSGVAGSYTVPTVTQYFSNTATTFNGANESGSLTLNTNGLQVSLSGLNQAVSNSAGSFTFQTLNFSNANNVTWGTSAGNIVTASVAAPGAAAENNWVNLLGANTAGNTTASGSTIGVSGINLTLSGTNGSVYNISAPATSSLVGTNGISISSNGSTISISQVINTLNSTNLGIDLAGAPSSISLGQNSLYFFPENIEAPVQGSIMKFPVNVTLSSSAAGAFTRGHTASFAVYSRSDTGANSQTLSRLYSTSYTMSAVMSSNANMSIAVITAIGNSTSYNSTTNNSAGLNLSASVHGAREFIMPWNTTLTTGEYWFAFAQSSSSAGGAGNVLNVSNGVYTYSTVNRMGISTNASDNGIQKNIGMGTYSATSGGFPSTLPITDIRGGATWPIAYLLQGTV